MTELQEISISKCISFRDNPFKIKDDMNMEMLIDSIKNYGVMVPVVVRPQGEDSFEVISGHRRIYASKKAGLETIPAFVQLMTRDEATIFMVDSNLHRDGLLPSEKAFAYRMKLEAVKHQGRTSTQVGQKLTSIQQIADLATDSRSQIQRYIRLTNLEKPLLDLVDNGRIALTPAVELSYLQPVEQRAVAEVYARDEVTPSYAQAVRLRKLSEQGLLTVDKVFEILSEVKPNQREYFKLSSEKCNRYLSRFQTAQQKEDFVLKALDYYSKYLERQRNRDAR